MHCIITHLLNITKWRERYDKEKDINSVFVGKHLKILSSSLCNMSEVERQIEFSAYLYFVFVFGRVKLPYVTSMYLAYDQRDYAIMQLYIIETFSWPDQLY